MNDLTDAIYWASKDPKVQAIHSLPFDEREAAAAALAAQGFTIDRQIDIWDWQPTLVMQYRQGLGLAFTPAASFDGLPLPAKFIKVSTNASDYPPLVPPPVPDPEVKPVGTYIGNGLYAANIVACVDHAGNLLFHDGQHYTQDNVEFVFHYVPTPFGPSINWTRA